MAAFLSCLLVFFVEQFQHGTPERKLRTRPKNRLSFEDVYAVTLGTPLSLHCLVLLGLPGSGTRLPFVQFYSSLEAVGVAAINPALKFGNLFVQVLDRLIPVFLLLPGAFQQRLAGQLNNI